MSSVKTNRLTTPLIVGFFVILVCLRNPNVILDGGRFWAEEGTLYFYNAWYQPWYQCWFNTLTGYINFTAAFASWAAMYIAGIKYAPVVTVATALLIQCLPVYIITTHDFPWRKSTLATVLAVAMCALTPCTGEVWLNTITSQFHLALCAALIFASPSTGRALFYTDCAILLLGSFSGPVTCFLFPFFALFAAISRDREAIIKTVIVGAGFLIQLWMYAINDTSLRDGHLRIDELFSVVSVHTITIQLGGFKLANDVGQYFSSADAAHQILWLGPLTFLLFYGVLAFSILRSHNLITAKLLCAGVFISLISFYEAIFGGFHNLMGIEYGERYAFIPLTVNGLVVVALASISQNLTRKIYSAMVCLMLVIGIADYRLQEGAFDNGPAWYPQISVWSADPYKAVFVWPDKNWPLRLTADHVINSPMERRHHGMRQ